MKRIRIIAVFLAGLFGASYANAQEVLSLQQAIKYALQNKAEAKTAALDLENSEYMIDEVRGTALPQISGSASMKKNVIIPEMALENNGQVMTVKMGQPWNSTAMLSLNQQLFNQSVFTGLKAAKTTREFYAINKDLTEEQLIERVATAYYEVFQTQMQLKTVDINLNSTTKTRDVIKGLVDAGLAKKIDLDRMNVAINNLKASRQIYAVTLDLRQNALKFAIGMSMSNEINLPQEAFEVNANIALMASDLDNRTEIKLSEKQIQLLELNKKAAVANLYPRLSLGADYGFSGFGKGFPIGGNFNWPKTSSIGLNLSFPIFTGGSTKAKINQADVQIRQAKVSLQDLKLGLALANDNALAQMKSSLLIINTNRGNVELAKNVLDDIQNNYRNGLASLTDLLDAENAYADAQNNFTTSLLDYKVAEIQLMKAKGELKTLVNEN